MIRARSVVLSALLAFSVLQAEPDVAYNDILPSESQTIELKSGWNMVSLPGYTSLSLKSLFNSSKITRVWAYEDGWYPYSSATGSDQIGYINPTKGYWVKVADGETFTIVAYPSSSTDNSSSSTSTTCVDSTGATITAICDNAGNCTDSNGASVTCSSSSANTWTVCTAEYDPVCANGNTYSNSCMAEAAGENSYTSGACDSSTSALDETTATKLASALVNQAMLYKLGLDSGDYTNKSDQSRASYDFTYEGSCGGSVDVTLGGTLGEESSFSVAADYDNYCGEVIQADGKITSSAYFELLKLTKLNMSASSFTTQYGSMDGSLDFAFDNYKYTDLTGLSFLMELDGTVTPGDLDGTVVFDNMSYDFENYAPDTLSFDYAVNGTIGMKDGISATADTTERVYIVNLEPVSGEIDIKVGETNALLFVQEGVWYISMDLYGDDDYDVTKTLQEFIDDIKKTK